MKKPLMAIVLCIAGLYLIVCLFMLLFQRNLMYFPDRNVAEPAAYGLSGFDDLQVKISDNVQIQAWYHKAVKGYPTIVYFHGNAGNLGNRAKYFKILSDEGFGIFGMEYEGYGTSGGKPSEQAFYNDARASIGYLQNELGLKQSDMVFYGESIGTGVAVQVATEYKPALLVLQSPYTSMAALSYDRYKWLPVNLLLKDRFDSIDKIAQVHSPLLLFHGEVDNIVPEKYGKILFDVANAPKQAYFIPNTGHNDFDLDNLSKNIIEFCDKNGLIK